jgi:hypothetical protein
VAEVMAYEKEKRPEKMSCDYDLGRSHLPTEAGYLKLLNLLLASRTQSRVARFLAVQKRHSSEIYVSRL